MDGDSSLLTKHGFVVFRRLLLALFLLAMVAIGFWMLNQVLDSVVIFGRSFVNVPGYPAPVSVWTYHDAAFSLLWVAYAGLVAWEMTPWAPGQLTSGRVLIAIFGFALLTAGLWISQDLMNAILILNRTYVDLPFFLGRLDQYQTRDAVSTLVILSYVSFYVLIRIARPE
ncbi:MAG: hypothetical protein JRN11_08300 [Nitrososphaerota archaeon]|jgi:hypothetical protein|nr:hypothetical protein [Nitrososphaerota archaeon]MDG6972752.1 hypothetical protein [Nitrososphaerota archaeon]MDG6974019.1 hypothetical protein [Nitrososphaerota archaeon]MDG6987573.1 hypothetical protein [Nitrososphaerota archaeon]MDG7026735.1 hypothetical protein [Nitrososphaerota archaeon]